MNLRHIKNYLDTKIGSRMVIIYHGSMNRKEKYCGFLFKTYSNIFVIKLLNGDIKSFSYIDILTKTIQICV